jgi:hypothetical protein
MKSYNHVIYRLKIADVQHVAKEEFGRTLTDDELEIIEEEVGDNIKWYEIIEMTISNNLNIEPIEKDTIEDE